MNYVGVDHHRQYSHLTVMDQEGQVLRSGRVSNVRVAEGRGDEPALSPAEAPPAAKTVRTSLSGLENDHGKCSTGGSDVLAILDAARALSYTRPG